MTLAAGTRLGPYDVLALIGAGGMGEVYRARDSKLNRDVAIKVLPEEFAGDPERIARFHREAQAVAALNHPNVAAIYGFAEGPAAGHDASPIQALVLELVEGDTLDERLRRGPVPIEESLNVARQICEALEAAHEKGIVHRDLKPANVKITPDGKVKVLDFGLAKALETAPSNVSVSNSPTLSLAGTRAGVILGTAAYMSPEQAKGFAADHRSDIFSFGCVLYEMLTGRQAFDGDTVSDILASVLKTEADLNRLPPKLNPRIRELLRRCLAKNPKDRWHAAADVRVEIEAAVAEGALIEQVRPIEQRPLWKRSIPIAAGMLLAGLISGLGAWILKPTPPVTITRFPIILADGQNFIGFGRNVAAISPDGTTIAFAANEQLYLRSMSELEARAIPGTAMRARNPVFSPDGSSIAFYSLGDGTFKRITVTGGAPVTICPGDNPFGMSWDQDGIVFGQGSKGIMRVSANGGKPETLVTVNEGEVAHGPQLLSGGDAVLFTLAPGGDSTAWDSAQIVVQSLESGERKTLIEGGSDARYVPTGHIVYALSGTLLAVPFDARRLEVTGGPVPVVEGVRRGTNPPTMHFSFSDSGSLIYIPGPVSMSAAQRDLAWSDRDGVAAPLKFPPGPYQFPRISPDGRRVAFETEDGKDAIVWVYDLDGSNSMRRLTFGGRNKFPIWSADSERVAFQSDREGDGAIFWQRADGTGAAERLTEPDEGTTHAPESWSPNGENLLYRVGKGSEFSLWTFSLKEKKAAPFGGVRSSYLTNAVFSPDGRWVAYHSHEAGRTTDEVFVQPFPATGAKYQLPDRRDNHHPLWLSAGKELFYDPGPGLPDAVVSVTTDPTFAFGNPVPVTIGVNMGAPTGTRPFDVTPDGKRFIGVVAAQSEGDVPLAPQIQVVLNWFEDLKARVPVP